MEILKSWKSIILACAVFAMEMSIGRADQAAPVYTMVKINVADLRRSLDFYTRVLGMREVWRIGSDDFTELVLDVDKNNGNGFNFVLVYNKGRTISISPTGIDTLVVIKPTMVAIKATVERVSKEGFKIQTPPTVADMPQLPLYPGGADYAVVTDPDGYTVELIHFRK